MTNENLVENLRILATADYDKDIHGISGLCSLLTASWTTFLPLDRHQYTRIKDWMWEWSLKHGTRSSVFPVPSFNKRILEGSKFERTTAVQKWSKRTKYGRSRRHMCNFIANDIEAETKRN